MTLSEGNSNNGLWLTSLSAPERRTLVATFGGWALDGMDVMVYSFVIPSLIAAWHISKGQAGMLGTAALLISAVGGWLAGLLADRFGRTRVLQWTILWFATFTFLSEALPTASGSCCWRVDSRAWALVANGPWVRF